jgi:nucleoside-diphosphate-sugar epimerase
MILVTGGTGLVGSYLLYDLVCKGYEVKAIRREHSKLDAVKRIFNHLDGHGNRLFEKIRWVEADLLDIDSLEDALAGVTDVYHCAAMVSFNPRRKQEMITNNLQGTANLVNAALAGQVRKFCHVSSVSALAKSAGQPLVNDESGWRSSKKDPPYAISKYESEREVWRGMSEGLNAVIVSPAIIIGYGDAGRDSGRLIPSISKISLFYTGGANGMVGVRDVTRAMILLMESDISQERFILNSENKPFRELTAMIAGNLGKRKPIIRVPAAVLGLLWRFEHVRSCLFGSEPFITHATAKSSRMNYYFDGSKITKQIDFQYTPLEQVVKEACAIYLRANK